MAAATDFHEAEFHHQKLGKKNQTDSIVLSHPSHPIVDPKVLDLLGLVNLRKVEGFLHSPQSMFP